MKHTPIISALILLLSVLVPIFGHAAGRDLVVITDMEPDDRIALEMVAARLSNRVQFIGTTVKNSFRKAALVRDQLARTKLRNIPVIVGSGGESSDYAEIASSKAAREYHQEGAGILSEDILATLNSPEFLKGSSQLKVALQESLTQALQSGNKIEILLLAPPTDLVSVLEADPRLKNAIKHIHVMGGWVDAKNPKTEVVEKRTTYNVNMDGEASSKLMNMTDIPMTLYSSHIIKPNFAGGSVSHSNFPQIIDQIEAGQSHGLSVFRIAGKSWDTHLMEMIPPLKNVIGDNAGKQFTPADPLVVVGLLNSTLIKESAPVAVKIDVQNVDPARGYLVDVVNDSSSQIRLVTAIDTEVFAVETLRSLELLERGNLTNRISRSIFSCVKALTGNLGKK